MSQILAKHKEESTKKTSGQSWADASSLAMAKQFSLEKVSASNNGSRSKSILKIQSSEVSVASDGEAKNATRISRVSFQEDPVVAMAASIAEAPEQSPTDKKNGTSSRSRQNSLDVEVLQVGQPTPKSLMIKCVDHAEVVDRINKRLLSGLQVNAKEWEELRSSIHMMSKYFEEECRFGWNGEA